MVLQNYQNLIEVTSNMIYIVAFGVGLKCPRKIHLNKQCVCGGEGGELLSNLFDFAGSPYGKGNIFYHEYLDGSQITSSKLSIDICLF